MEGERKGENGEGWMNENEWNERKTGRFGEETLWMKECRTRVRGRIGKNVMEGE